MCPPWLRAAHRQNRSGALERYRVLGGVEVRLAGPHLHERSIGHRHFAGQRVARHPIAEQSLDPGTGFQRCDLLADHAVIEELTAGRGVCI